MKSKNRTFLSVAIAAALMCSCGSQKQENPFEGMSYEEVCESFDTYAFEQRDLLKEIRQKHSSDKAFIARFNEEQGSWIQFQDKRLRALYPKDWDTHYRQEYGRSTFNACKCKELIRMTKIRNEDLKVYLNGPIPEQDECPTTGNSLVP